VLYFTKKKHCFIGILSCLEIVWQFINMSDFAVADEISAHLKS